MINSIFLALMAVMGLIGFCYVTFYDATKDIRKKVYQVNCFQFGSRYLAFLNAPIHRVCITIEIHLYEWIAGCLSVFFAYFPVAIIFGLIDPHSSISYTHAFIGDVVGMWALMWALIIRKGNVAQLLSRKNAQAESANGEEKTS